MDTMLEQINTVWEQAYSIWLSGGWGMIALAINALLLYGLGMHVHLKLSEKGFRDMPEKIWRRWISHPDEREGHIGDMLDFVANGNSLNHAAVLFQELRTTEIDPFGRDLRVMKICISASPLLGLLGTVTGMLTTFGALASGSGGEATMGLVAGGISEALITTETGLVIALPGLFFQYHLARQHERYKGFLAHIETVYTQILYRKLLVRKAQHEQFDVITAS